MRDESKYFRVLELAPGYPFNLAFHCPGCKCSHGVNTDPSRQPLWQLTFADGKPTVNPSLLVRSGNEKGPTVCHSFIRNGNIEYLGDCTHELAGKTIPMELEEQ